MAPEQDWCLACGAGAPGSIGTPSWRSSAIVLGAVAILALGAAAAGYAALSKGKTKARVATTTLAQATPPASVTPSTPGTGTLGSPGTPTTIKPALPLGTVKPPKIPLKATLPKIPTTAGTSTPSAATPTNTSTATSPSPAATGGAGEAAESTPAAILLDTNAASTYNPYNYPASDFGDPSLTIDGDTSTGWTAQVDPATAPKMAEGVLLNLKTPQKLSAAELVTSTTGMTVQVYGATGHTVPPSITDPAWRALSPSMVVKKKHVRISLRDSTKGFSFVALWISRAPASSVGTPAAPGHVSVNELELLPAAG